MFVCQRTKNDLSLSLSYSVWKLNLRGSCARYEDYIKFYSTLIDENKERKQRKCSDCIDISKRNNTIIVQGNCRYHVLRALSEVVSFSSLILVPDLNLIKYEEGDLLHHGLEVVDVYKPTYQGEDFRTIHVLRRSFGKKWNVELPL